MFKCEYYVLERNDKDNLLNCIEILENFENIFKTEKYFNNSNSAKFLLLDKDVPILYKDMEKTLNVIKKLFSAGKIEIICEGYSEEK